MAMKHLLSLALLLLAGVSLAGGCESKMKQFSKKCLKQGYDPIKMKNCDVAVVESMMDRGSKKKCRRMENALIKKCDGKCNMLTDSGEEECVDEKTGVEYSQGDTWSPDPCSQCTCTNNGPMCTVIDCPQLDDCKGTVMYEEGVCCPVCAEPVLDSWCDHDGMYLDGYSSGKKRYPTLQEAQDECLNRNDCGGVTYEPTKKKYSLRSGTMLMNSDSSEITWVRCEGKDDHDAGCPGGLAAVQCSVNPCDTATCPNYPTAECEPNYCGECNAIFRHDSGEEITDCEDGEEILDSWCRHPDKFLGDYSSGQKRYGTLKVAQEECLTRNDCSGITYEPNTKKFSLRKYSTLGDSDIGEVSWIRCSGEDSDDHEGGCPDGDAAVYCPEDPCDTATCPNDPTAECENNYCGECSAIFRGSDGGEIIDCGDDEEILDSWCRHPDKFLGGYSSGQKKYGTLKVAQEECLTRNDCSGVTYEPNTKKYTLRKFSTLGDSDNGEVTWVRCSGEEADDHDAGCPGGLAAVQCVMNPCDTATCPNYPTAECEPNYCGECNAIFRDDSGEEITDCEVKQDVKELLSCDFEIDTCNYTDDADADFMWTRNSGKTHTGDTGPDNDHTSGSGYYVYIETSSPRVEGDIAVLVSPWIDRADCSIEFYTFMRGPSMGEFNFYIQMEDGTKTKRVNLSEASSDATWTMQTVDLSDIEGRFRVLFEGVRGRGIRGDIGLDDISYPDC